MSNKNGGDWWKKYQNDEKYSNSVRQHQQRAKRKVDEDGFYLEDEESPKTSYLEDWQPSYDYGYKQSFKKKDYDFSNDWKSYEKSGVWKGYNSYRSATLSYKYVQQMANTIAAQGGVKIEIGDTWRVDIDNRKLTYNPTSLMYGTKGELLATLLHEVGKISNSTGRSKLESLFLKIHGDPAYIALNVFEDMRIDMIMLESYPSAGEVYESNTVVVEQVANAHLEKGKLVRNLLAQEARSLYSDLLDQIQQNQMMLEYHKDREKLLKDYIKLISAKNLKRKYETVDEIKQHFKDFEKELQQEPMLDEYVADMLRVSYGLESMQPVPNCDYYTNATAGKVAEAVKLNNTQEVISMMDTDVYPIIEKLLKQPREGTEKQNEFFSEALAKRMAQRVDSYLGGSGNQVGLDGQGNQMPRMKGGGRSDENVPKEWANGDYNSLRESVDYEIKQLTNRLNFIRREEETNKYQGGQRRGKLDMKRLYRYAVGNRRIFKKIMPRRDTIQSFAFSLMVDMSGSMLGSRMINATRGAIILTEVFSRFNIPFELIAFDTEAKVIKSFETGYDKEIKGKIGHMATLNGGGTTLACALKKTKIQNQPEANKIVLVLTDGDTEDHNELDSEYFIPWEKKGIKALGIGIETDEQIKTLCHNNGVNVENSAKLPEVFSKTLRDLIKR